MPNYEYMCVNCSTQYSTFRPIDDLAEHPKYCTKCKTDGLKRIYTVPGIIFNGTGWAGKD